MAKELLGSLELNRIYQRDCLSDGGMALIPDKSIDMILCDLPYGTTQNKWDSIIPFESLWKQYSRIIKDNGAMALTASQPFTSALVMSNPKLFKYEWIWKKSPFNFLNASHQPLRNHESVLVFYKKKPVYNAQEVELIKYKTHGKSFKKTESVGDYDFKYIEKEGYALPRTIIEHIKKEDTRKIKHPTQKPVALFEYLIKTYTNEGDIVLDNCMGSGTTAVAAINNNRKFIGFETEPAYIEIANKRIDDLR
jgi:site-specific DNA-methyltransferase (adenine-specific)